MKIEVELGGGLELIATEKKKMHSCEVNGESGECGTHDEEKKKTQTMTIREFLPWVRDNIIVERHELFMKDDSVYVIMMCVCVCITHLLWGRLFLYIYRCTYLVSMCARKSESERERERERHRMHDADA